jgi:aryl-alcohol dehydrogenase-like predicted oxidoreductase
VSGFHAKDIRRSMPRFAPDNYARNLVLLDRYVVLAQRLGCTPSQLALAWLMARGDHIIPIPGTTSVAHLRDDLGANDISLTPEVMAELDALINERTVVGPRYNAATQTEIDTEMFAP